MSFAYRCVRFRFGLRPKRLIWALIGVGCVKVGLALPAGSGAFGASSGATAAQWISGAGSLILLALLGWDVRKDHPGITSLFRRYACAAIAGSLLPIAANRHFVTGVAVVPPLPTALAGLVLTLFSAMLLEWLLRDVRLDGPLPSESVMIERLAALSSVLKSGARPFPPARSPQHSTTLLRIA